MSINVATLRRSREETVVRLRAGSPPDAGKTASFDEQFTAVFEIHFHRLFGYLDRLSGDSELASDLAQEAFIRLYRRGALPDAPPAWLITVATNLFRNSRLSNRRRAQLLTASRGEYAHSDPPPSADEAVLAEERRREVRVALNRLPERDCQILLLRAEGYSYQEIATALDLNEASVGVMLARAKRSFLDTYDGPSDAS